MLVGLNRTSRLFVFLFVSEHWLEWVLTPGSDCLQNSTPQGHSHGSCCSPPLPNPCLGPGRGSQGEESSSLRMSVVPKLCFCFCAFLRLRLWGVSSGGIRAYVPWEHTLPGGSGWLEGGLAAGRLFI